MDALISAAGVLLGALIGLGGAQLAHNKSAKLARELRRVERTQEIQAEVIPKLFMLLKVHKDGFEWVLDAPSRWTDETRAEITEAFREGGGPRVRFHWNKRVSEWEAEEQVRYQAFHKKREEFDEYFGLNKIWLPEVLITATENLRQQYNKHGMKVQAVLKEWQVEEAWRALAGVPNNLQALESFKEELDRELDSYDAQVSETRAWFQGDRSKLENDLWDTARKVLKVVAVED